jgi:hypothetical protein
MPDKLLTEDEVAEIADMFPHAEYQPKAEAMPLCSFCDGAVDDHKANCVVPHVHALCHTVRALCEKNAELQRRNDTQYESIMEYQAEEKSSKAQLAQLTGERDRWKSRADQLAIKGQGVADFRTRAVNLCREFAQRQANGHVSGAANYIAERLEQL